MLKQFLYWTVMTSSCALAQQGMPEAEKIYGGQYMTQKQRVDYRASLLAANTDQAREEIRRIHHELMDKRAKARGTSAHLDGLVPGGGMAPIRGMGGG